MNPNVNAFLDGAKRLRAQLDNAIAAVETFFETDRVIDPPGQPLALPRAAVVGPVRLAKAKRGGCRKGVKAAPVAAAAPVKDLGRQPAVPPVKRAEPPARSASNLDKPLTVGGAMKLLFKQRGKLTRTELKEALLADADWAKAHEASPSNFAGNLCYWSTSGKLKKSGDENNETFTVAEKSFFE